MVVIKDEMAFMSRQRKSPTTIASRDLDERDVHLAPKVHTLSRVGMFKDDPTFAEFREIMQQQRKEDYRKTREAMSVRFVKGESLDCADRHPRLL